MTTPRGRLRLVSGSLGGRRLRTSGALSIRPTLQRVREALLASLGEQILDATVLDLFAGTGALGFEAISRGARRAVFVENNRGAVELLRTNAEELAVGPRALVVAADAFKVRSRLAPWAPFHVVFIDPPWRYWNEAATRARLAVHLETLHRARLLADQAVLALEEPRSSPCLATDLGWPSWRPPKDYGETRITLLQTPEKRT